MSLSSMVWHKLASTLVHLETKMFLVLIFEILSVTARELPCLRPTVQKNFTVFGNVDQATWKLIYRGI